MEDFYSIAIGLGLGVAIALIGCGIGAFCAWLTKPRQNAGDEHADWQGIGGGGFFHNGHPNNSLSERNNG